MPTPSALHSAKTPKWGTPSSLVEKARILLDGRIDTDPASSPEFNLIVQATQIYTEHTNGLIQVWNGNTFLNPPGGFIIEFWRKLMESISNGTVEKAFWVGFSVEQLCLLADQEFHPLDFSSCILRKRTSFNTEALMPSGAPSHGNYVTALGCDQTKFEELFHSLGKIIHGNLA